jgi:site-specific DNA-methyltransferase (adenine-specific)
MSLNTKVMFSSVKVSYSTPIEIYNALNKEFNFNDDPCPLSDNSIEGLLKNWGTSTFCNPPYGHNIDKWLSKGYLEAQQGKTVVFLIPSWTDTKWWHNYVMKATEIRFIKGRLKFGNSKNSAPFPSCIAIFNHSEVNT